jgi:hypothetical protein
MSVFAVWQPEYAARGIATFPVKDKRPAVGNYLRMGLPASHQLVARFPASNGLGIACKRNGLAIVDVDAPDENLLADALDENGPTPFIVRSGSGNFQAWYRNSGERRRIRPNPDRPIDILGDGFVVAPPSAGRIGNYEIISGSLDDLTSLPKRIARVTKPQSSIPPHVGAGRRNDALWRACMQEARSCADFTELARKAAAMNKTMFYDPLPDEEVLRVVASAWLKEEDGTNWFGRGGRIVVGRDEVDGLLKEHPDAFILLMILRRYHWRDAQFVVANAMADTMPGRWARKRFSAARKVLEDLGLLEIVTAASRYSGPATYQFKGGRI